MNPKTAEKVLTVLFRLNAILLTSAFLTIFLPVGWMESLHARLGLGEMPRSAITEYLARSCSLLYAMHGIVLLVVSADLRKYWQLVPLLAWMHAGLGAVVLGIDIKAGMPWYWTAAEGPGIMVFAVVLLGLWKTADREVRQQVATP